MLDNEFTVATNQYALIKSALMGYTGSAYIRELIQNASDSRKNSKEKVVISFNFCKDKLIVENSMKFSGDFSNLHKNIDSYSDSQGDMSQFDDIKNKIKDDDWARICIQRSDLKNLDKQNNIGRFGIGFRSVFRICDEPIVESDCKRICFSGVRAITGSSEISQTRFTFKYRFTKTRVSEELGVSEVTSQDIENYFQDAINSKLLILFLENVREINLLRDSVPVKKITRNSNSNEIEIKEIMYQNNEETISVFKSFSSTDGKVRLFFPTKKSDSLHRQKIYSWFPTKYEVDLPFFINADFEVDDNRYYFNPNEKDYNNEKLVTCAEVFLENIEEIKESFRALYELPGKPYLPYEFYDFITFRQKLPEDVEVLESAIQNELMNGDYSLIHTPLGWRKFNDSYLIEPKLVSEHGDLLFLFENNEGKNYFDCFENDYFEEYYDFFKRLRKISVFGREKVTSYLSEMKNLGKKIDETQIKTIDNLIPIYNYLKDIGIVSQATKIEKIKEIRNLPIFLNDSEIFTSCASLYYDVPPEILEITKLFNFRAAFDSVEHHDELINFYNISGLNQFSVSNTLIEKLKGPEFRNLDGLLLEKAPQPLNEENNLLLILRIITQKRESSDNTELDNIKLPLLLDSENHICYTNSDELRVLINQYIEQFLTVITKTGIPLLKKSFIDFKSWVSEFCIGDFLKKLETNNDKMNKSELIDSYAIINFCKEDVRYDSTNKELLLRLPIFYTIGNKRVSLSDNDVFFLDFKGHKPETGMFVDESFFDSGKLEGFKEFLLHIGARKYNYDEFVKNHLEKEYVTARSDDKQKLLKQILTNYADLTEAGKSIVHKMQLFHCKDRTYRSSDEGVFFSNFELIKDFGNQLDYIDYPPQFITENKHWLATLGVLNWPSGKFVARLIKQLVEKKDSDSLLKVMGYVIEHFDYLKNAQEFNSIRELPCIPDQNLILRQGDQIYNLPLKSQLDALDDINFIHKDIYNLNPNKEVMDFFGIIYEVTTDLIIRNLQASVQLSKIGGNKNFLSIYRTLNERASNRAQWAQLQKLLEFQSIAILTNDENSKTVDVKFYLPSRTFKESIYLDKIGTKYVEKLPNDYQPFSRLFDDVLGVKSKIDIDSLMSILEEIKSANTLEDQDIVRNIYRIISELVKNRDINVSQLAQYADRQIILVNNEFKKPSEVFINDNNEITALFQGTNVENLIITIEADVHPFYQAIGINPISHVKKFNSQDFENKEKNGFLTEKIDLIYSAKDEILTFTRRDMNNEKGTLDELERLIDGLQLMTVYNAEHILVEVTIPGTIIKPSITSKSIKSCIEGNDIFISKKIDPKEQEERLAIEIGNYIFQNEISSLLFEKIIQHKTKDQVKKYFAEKHNITVKESTGYSSVPHNAAIIAPMQSNIVDQPQEREEIPKRKDIAEIIQEPSIGGKTPILLPIGGKEPNTDSPRFGLSGKPQKGNLMPTDEETKEYFLSDKWKKTQERCLESAGHKCSRCGGHKELHAHHLNYHNFKNEKDEDLQCLCKNCHEKIHGKKFSEYPVQFKPETDEGTVETEAESVKEPSKIGKTRPLDFETNFQQRAEEIYKKRVANREFRDVQGHPILFGNEPWSEEETETYIKKEQEQIQQEIGQITNENKKREKKLYLEGLKDIPEVKTILSNMYKGRCQICQFNHGVKAMKLIPKRYGGLRTLGNALYLCPNHSVLFTEGLIDISNVLKGYVIVDHKKEEIELKKEHGYSIEALWKFKSKYYEEHLSNESI